jgi:hypothetical protein
MVLWISLAPESIAWDLDLDRFDCHTVAHCGSSTLLLSVMASVRCTTAYRFPSVRSCWYVPYYDYSIVAHEWLPQILK